MKNVVEFATGLLILVCVVYFAFKSFLYVFKPEFHFTFIEAGILTAGILAMFVLWISLDYLRSSVDKEHNKEGK